MRYTKDIVDVKRDVEGKFLEVKIYGDNIILCDLQSGEAVKVGEVKKEV